MIAPLFPNLDVTVGATFSPDRRHRYDLTRLLANEQPGRTVTFVCCNPSTADETTNDPTVRRIIGFARSWGFTRLRLVNIFSLRSTDPAALLDDPLADGGEENDRAIVHAATLGIITVCAWGVHGALRGRGEHVARLLRTGGMRPPHARSLYHLGLTKDGYPRHPLYLRSDTEPQLWEVS